MRNRPIGIFDSGVGGLTVMSEIIKKLPRENIIYLGDNLRVPYGPRPPAQVRGFVFEIISYLQSQNVKLVVIACNTATAAGLQAAQEHFELPIIGVIEPGARGAVMATRNRRVGIIGTKGTVASRAYSRAVRALDAGITTFSVACPKFVEIIENGLISAANVFPATTYTTAKSYLTPVLQAEIDTLILGCTHYPLLKEVLSKICGPRVTLISSAEETATEVEQALVRKGLTRTVGSEPVYRYLATGDERRFRILGGRFLGRDIPRVEKLIL